MVSSFQFQNWASDVVFYWVLHKNGKDGMKSKQFLFCFLQTEDVWVPPNLAQWSQLRMASQGYSIDSSLDSYFLPTEKKGREYFFLHRKWRWKETDMCAFFTPSPYPEGLLICWIYIITRARRGTQQPQTSLPEKAPNSHLSIPTLSTSSCTNRDRVQEARKWPG